MLIGWILSMKLSPDEKMDYKFYHSSSFKRFN